MDARTSDALIGSALGLALFAAIALAQLGLILGARRLAEWLAERWPAEPEPSQPHHAGMPSRPGPGIQIEGFGMPPVIRRGD